MTKFCRLCGLWLLAVGLPLVAAAQTDACPPGPSNLLPDPGFESQNQPLSGVRFNVGPSSGAQANDIASWQSANDATPDYFATNEPAPSTPNNPPTVQSSNPAYSDIGPFTPLDNNSSTNNGTIGLATGSTPLEYITPSSGPLTFAQGGSYYASFWVYRVYNPDFGYTAASGLGLGLTPINHSGSTDDIAFPDGQNSRFYQSGTINAAGQWVHVAGIINNVQANQPYYVIVGNIGPAKARPAGKAYYYIDNVTLYRIPTVGPLQVNTACGSVTIGEGNPIPCATYHWSSSNNDLTPSQVNQLQIVVSPTVQTNYTLTVTLPGQGSNLTPSVVTYSTTVSVNPSQAKPTPTFAGSPLPSNLCLTSGSQDYNLYVNSQPGATGYTWTLSPAGNASIIFGNGTGHVLVHFPSGDYTTTVSVVANYACGSSAAAVQTVRVSSAMPAYPVLTQDAPINYINKNQAKFFIDNFSPTVKYTVTNIQYANPTSPPGFSNNNFIVKGGGGNSTDYYGYFTITAENACGSVTTDPIQVTYWMGDPSTHRTLSTTAYPNPATEYLTLPEAAESAVLLDAQGTPVQQLKGPQLDVRRLPAGLYNLRMMQAGKVVNQRIQVQH